MGNPARHSGTNQRHRQSSTPEIQVQFRLLCQQTSHTMNRICKQVSIESPASVMGKEYVFSYDVMVPDLPPHGASVSSTSSSCSYGSDSGHISSSPSRRGIRDSSFYPGYEVAGVVESVGSEADP